MALVALVPCLDQAKLTASMAGPPPFPSTLVSLSWMALLLFSCALQDQVKLTALMAGPLGQLQAAARKVAEVSLECKLEVDVGESRGA